MTLVSHHCAIWVMGGTFVFCRLECGSDVGCKHLLSPLLRREAPGPSTTQAARLIGIYHSQVAFGQSRVVWIRLIMPNGRSIELERHRVQTPWLF
jgi:hypothetical protein